ncbi:MAG: hemolysin family protein, partial [Patescibacteria group bacterium]|nr:hemolysin family protein [Patescibacteria group bacterium]
MFTEQLPWLLTMGVLMLASAFFSASEAALFSLSRADRRRLAAGNAAQRSAAALLAVPDRLLTAVLFWNLLSNVAYFTIASILSLQLEQAGHKAEAGLTAIGLLMGIIVFGEMLPKSLAVLRPAPLATWAAVPMSGMVRLLDPVMPVLRLANLLSQRLLWPGFQPEPYLRLGDLERAVELSTADAALVVQEQQVLQSLVLLSETRVDEMMRPRTQFRTFRPPVNLADLQGRMTPSGYLLVTEPNSDEVARAIGLRNLPSVPTEHLDRLATPIAYVPWCATVADALETMRRQGCPVAGVVNELGETIGILTLDDVMDTIFSHSASRTERLLRQQPIRKTADQTWQVSGIASLRRIARYFDLPRPPSKSMTVAGAIQETLGRIAEPGDTCVWGPFELRVLEISLHGPVLVELRMAAKREDEP